MQSLSRQLPRIVPRGLICTPSVLPNFGLRPTTNGLGLQSLRWSSSQIASKPSWDLRKKIKVALYVTGGVTLGTTIKVFDITFEKVEIAIETLKIIFFKKEENNQTVTHSGEGNINFGETIHYNTSGMEREILLRGDLFKRCDDDYNCKFTLNTFFSGTGVIKFKYRPVHSTSCLLLCHALRENINSSVYGLNFSKSDLYDDQLEMIIENLKNNKTIRFLNIGNHSLLDLQLGFFSISQIPHHNLHKLAEMLRVNDTLEELILDYCSLSHFSMDILEEALANNPNSKLRTLSLVKTDVTQEKKDELSRRLNIKIL